MHAKSKRFRWITVLLIGSLLGLGVWHWLHSPPTELDLKLYFGTPPEPPEPTVNDVARIFKKKNAAQQSGAMRHQP